MSKVIESFKNKFNKKFGEVIKTGNELPTEFPIWSSTGSLKLDSELRIGGIPKNCIIEIYGSPHSGKSFLALNLVKELQQNHPEKHVLFINTERIIDKKILEGMGIKLDTFLQAEIADYNAVFTAIDEGVKTGEFPYIIIDSVAAIITASENESEYGDAMMAQLARAMSIGVKKLNSTLSSLQNGTSVIFLNQVRTNVGQKYGDTETPTGGQALGFYSQVRMKVWRGKVVKGEDDNPQAVEMKIKVVKNKLGRPFGKAEVVLNIGPDKWGIDPNEEVVDLALEYEIEGLRKAGAWLYYNDLKGTEQKFQGKEKFQEYLSGNKEEFESVRKKIMGLVSKVDLAKKGSFDDEMEG